MVAVERLCGVRTVSACVYLAEPTGRMTRVRCAKHGGHETAAEHACHHPQRARQPSSRRPRAAPGLCLPDWPGPWLADQATEAATIGVCATCPLRAADLVATSPEPQPIPPAACDAAGIAEQPGSQAAEQPGSGGVLRTLWLAIQWSGGRGRGKNTPISVRLDLFLLPYIGEQVLPSASRRPQ